MSLAASERRELLALARASIESALAHGRLLPFTPALLSPSLVAPRSCFVTLRHGAQLRGCCGTIDAPRPLGEDVWRNAWSAAFNDYRFAPLTAAEWPFVHIHVSVLDPPEPLEVTTEEQLLALLRPAVDGLIFEAGAARATFLPAVWEQVPDPAQFVRQLKMKAGWPAHFWSHSVRVSRYTTESFGESAGLEAELPAPAACRPANE